MHITQCFKHSFRDLWETNFKGIFAHYDGAVSFHFFHGNKINIVNCDTGLLSSISLEPNKDVILPLWWIFAHYQDRPLLICGKEKNRSWVTCISLSEGKGIRELPLEGLFTANSRMYLHESKLYITTFSPEKWVVDS